MSSKTAVTVYMFLMALINIAFHDRLDTFLAVLFFVSHIRNSRSTAREHRALTQDLQAAYARIDQLETEQRAMDSEIEQLTVERDRSFLNARRAEQGYASVSDDLGEAQERSEHLEKRVNMIRAEYELTAQALEASEVQGTNVQSELEASEADRLYLHRELQAERELCDVVSIELKAQIAAAQAVQEILEVENEELAERFQEAEQKVYDARLRADAAEIRLEGELKGREMRSSVCFEMLPWYLCEVRDDEHETWHPDHLHEVKSAPA